jgi:2-(1,2-epoxy-1,2-dihydrophenyl)acetyl-CoA isomerase
MSYQQLRLEIDGSVATITLDRPDAANTFNMELAHEFMLAADECDTNSNIRAVVLTGSGKMFCAGGDLKTFAGYGDTISAKLKEMTAYLHAGTSRLARMRAPVISAVNGTAAGAGFSVAIASDLVLAAESAKFTMAYTAAGLSPDGSSTYFLPRLVGLRRAQELMITNRRLSAHEALDWGLVTKVVPDDDLMNEANALAKQLASGATSAFGVVKRLLIDSYGGNLESQLELESRGIAEMASTQDGQEGINAFVARRQPEFKGE